jgi:type VI secretion system ImpM family protein
MGLFGLGPGRSSLRVGCFGKLRIFSDFVEPVHKVDFGQALRQWLVAAVGGEGPRLEEDGGGEGTVYRFLWPQEDGKEALVGVLWSSRDAVGRWFPFTLFTQLPLKRLGARLLEELPLAVHPLWVALQELALHRSGKPYPELAPGDAPVQELQKQVMDARVASPASAPLRGEFEESLRSLKALSLLEALFSPAFWVFYPRAAWVLIDAVRALRADGGIGSAVALRLPASPELNAAYQAGFWLRSVERLGAGRIRRPPVIFLPLREAVEKGIWLLWREPVALDLQVLMGRAAGHSFLGDLRRIDPSAAPGDEPPGFDAFVELLQRRLTRDLNGLELADIDVESIRASIAGG